MHCYVTQMALKLGRGRDLREVATHLNASSFPEERGKCIFFTKTQLLQRGRICLQEKNIYGDYSWETEVLQLKKALF